MDCMNNYSSLIHGHGHPAIVEAIQQQATRLTSVALPTESEIELAELLVERLDAIEQIRFCNSGTEAMLFAIKAARAYSGRPVIAKVEGAYHGSAETAAVSSQPGPSRWGPADSPASVPDAGSTPGVAADVVVLPMNDVDNGRRILRGVGSRLAAVVLDPLVKNLGFKPVTQEFLQMVREELQACGGLLVFDEVYSLRLGFHGAHATLGVQPDIIAMGKIIGGGLPIGAIGGRADIMTALFDPHAGARLGHAGTFNANPLTMAAGLAAMRAFDLGAFERLSALGDRLRKGLREALRIADVEGTVTGATSMTGFFLSGKSMSNYREIAALMGADPTIARRAEHVFHHLLNHGVYMGSYGFFVLSTAITEAEVDYIAETTLAALRTLPT
ncbi:aspartate aminotransferase family protein [Rubrivivax albus]|uniref:aspartate aminotransferase family protein n=1 Tax=Rubrivivax albus TaxID=2499835 RepID=UPI0035BF3882